MGYAPGTQFDPSLIFKGISGAGESIGGGISDLIKKRKHEEEQNAFNQTAFQTLATAKGPDGQPILTEEEKQRFTSGNLNVRNGIVAAGGARAINVFQTAKEKQALELANMHKQLLGAQTAVAQKSLEDNPYAQQPVWDNNGNQVGVFDDKGTPHYFPYGGLGPGGAQFQPPEDVTKTMKEAGYTFAPTSGRAGRWVNTTGNKPDLDESGNPMFTPDGSAYVSGGKVKPLTQTMIDQRKAWQQKQEDLKKGPSIFSSEYWTGSKPSPAPQSSPSVPPAASGTAPVTPPVQVKTIAEANALPSGTLFLTPDGKLKRKP